MHFLTAAVLTYTSVQVAVAFKLPFHVPWVHAALGERDQKTFTVPADVVSNRIAIIGAGAGGSAAAFWIGKAKERYGLDIEVDVFDSNPYIGGSELQYSMSKMWVSRYFAYREHHRSTVRQSGLRTRGTGRVRFCRREQEPLACNRRIRLGASRLRRR